MIAVLMLVGLRYVDGLYGVEIGDGCSGVDKGHKDMHSSVAGRVSRMDGKCLSDGTRLFLLFAFLQVCSQQSAVGAVVARATACSRYAKWLRLLRRRIEYKGERVGRIHKLWPGMSVRGNGWRWATSKVMWVLGC
jgi:hypothetical protein